MDMMTVGRTFYKFNAAFSSKVVDVRSGNSKLGRPASSFDTSFVNAKQDSKYLDAKIV